MISNSFEGLVWKGSISFYIQQYLHIFRFHTYSFKSQARIERAVNS